MGFVARGRGLRLAARRAALDALEMATWLRWNQALEGLVHHSGRGSTWPSATRSAWPTPVPPSGGDSYDKDYPQCEHVHDFITVRPAGGVRLAAGEHTRGLIEKGRIGRISR